MQQSIRKYLIKRSGSPIQDPDVKDSAKRIKLDVKDDDVNITKGPKSKCKRYRKGGLVDTLHGTVYQLKLLMLFLKRALDLKYEFNLGTEVDDAEKFDDLVFEYKSGNDKIRFLQAKHKQNESKKITARDLLAKNASGHDFSLQKYFTSYRKIKESPAFKKYELENFILCTNINFNFSDLKEAGLELEESKEFDEILYVNKSKKAALRYKFIVGAEHKLYQLLADTSDINVLADTLMQQMHNNLPVKISDDNIWKRFHVALRKAVYEPIEEKKEIKKSKKSIVQKYAFRDDFVEDRNLSEKVRIFRKALKSVFDNKDGDDIAFKNKLRESKIFVPSNFGEEFVLKSNPLITDPKALAQIIANNSYKAKENFVTIKRNLHVVKDNIDKLAGHVLVYDGKGALRFRKLFFDDNHEFDGNLNVFKNAFKKELEDKGIDFSTLRQYRYKITGYNTCKETNDGELLPNFEPELPSATIKGETIQEFFEKLIFAVNQPNEVELGNIIANELGDSVQFNLLNHDLIRDSFQREMLDWFKEKGDVKGKEGRFLDFESGKQFFDSIEQKLNSLICISLNLRLSGELQAHSIKFQKNDIFECLKKFLNPTNTLQKVLHLAAPDNTILIKIKMYNALGKLKQYDAKYKKQDSYIFMKLRELLQPQMQKIALEAFRALGSHHLLIIVCDSTREEIKIQELYHKLCNILLETNKPIILIANEDNNLVQKFSTDQKFTFESTTEFDDLTEKSKKKLLEKKVIFQGRKVGLQLKQLFSVNVIDSETLVQLISNKTIRIGRRLLGKSDLEGAYNKLYEFIKKDVLIEILRESANSIEEQSNNFFIVSGLDGGDKETFKENFQANENQSQNQICELKIINGRLCIKNKKIKKIILTDSKFEENTFKQLCDNYPNKNFHWIISQDNKCILHSQYHPKFIERQFKYPNKITFCGNIKELLNSSEDNTLYFTGVSTLEELFEILQLQNEIDKNSLNKNFKFGRIVIQTSSSGHECEFNKLAKEKAKENKSVYWLDVNNDYDEKQIIWRDVSRKTILETDLIDSIKDQSAIIIDKPGMGKSTTLAILSEKMLKTHWVVPITFRDWLEIINNLPEKIDNEVVIDFLSDTKNLNTHLEKNLARFLLDKEHEGGLKPLLFVFDGFDEIRSYDTENIGKKKVEELLRFLKVNTRSTIWITAREQDATKLQNILSLFCIKFEPLIENEHYDYFKNFWSNSFRLSVSKNEFDSIFSDGDSKFQIYYNALSKAADAIIANKDNDFMGIPLTLRLFAEGFRNKFKEFVFSNEANENFAKDFDNLSILNLYKFFIDKKLMIFIWEKTNLSAGFTVISEGWFREKLIKLHCRLAFKELFGGDETKELLGLKKPFEGEDSRVNTAQLVELLNVGIIRSIKEDHYEFLHRTVAEYLASRLLIYILKNKEHNNLAKYKRTIKFLHDNILKQSNEIIKNFLKAGSDLDKSLSDILQPIIIDKKYKNLLGQANNKYRFTIDAHRSKRAGNLKEIKQEIEKSLVAADESFAFNLKPTVFNNIICDKLKPSFIYETDIEKLQNLLGYLMDIYGIVYCPTGRTNSINIYLRDNITDFIDHYILQAEEQNKLDNDFLENCVKKICTAKRHEHIRTLVKSDLDLEKKNEAIEKVNKEFNLETKFSKNNIIDFIFASGILTPKMAELIKSKFSGDAKVIFNSLISPLLSFKYYCSKYSFSFFNNIDSTALLNMFQVVASASIKKKNYKANMDLSQVSLEGILLCIRESLNLIKVSKDSFTVSVKALIALRDWDFQLSYTNNALTLVHIHGYKSVLNLKHEERILELLIFRNNNPESNFELKLVDIASNILAATPASI